MICDGLKIARLKQPIAVRTQSIVNLDRQLSKVRWDLFSIEVVVFCLCLEGHKKNRMSNACEHWNLIQPIELTTSDILHG